MGFIYFYCINAIRDLKEKLKKTYKKDIIMNKSSFFIVGKHAVIEALKTQKEKF